MKRYPVSAAILAVLASLPISGCAHTAPSPQMADSMGWVHQHKGEGARRVLVGTEAQLMDEVAQVMGLSFSVTREPHALFAKSNESSISFSYAFYFYPSPVGGRTEVEGLVASNWMSAGAIAELQKWAVADCFPLAYLETRLAEPDFDPNVKERNLLALSVAALYDSRPIARKLIEKGADAKAAINELKASASANQQYLDHPENKRSYERATAGVTMLEALRKGAGQLEAGKASEARFQEALRAYRSATVKPQLPEDARRFKVQAEDAAKNKRFDDAADLFSKALQIAPWWPEGHFNRALILGELQEPDGAILEMKRYLSLVPNAANARAAQDRIYLWEGQAR